jgi:hypothetical protein
VCACKRAAVLALVAAQLALAEYPMTWIAALQRRGDGCACDRVGGVGSAYATRIEPAHIRRAHAGRRDRVQRRLPGQRSATTQQPRALGSGQPGPSAGHRAAIALGESLGRDRAHTGNPLEHRDPLGRLSVV